MNGSIKVTVKMPATSLKVSREGEKRVLTSWHSLLQLLYMYHAKEKRKQEKSNKRQCHVFFRERKKSERRAAAAI